eukprot:9470890-Pyramimonas_sp.AAC.1
MQARPQGNAVGINGLEATTASSFIEAVFSVLRDAPCCKGRAHPTLNTLLKAHLLPRLLCTLTASREALCDSNSPPQTASACFWSGGVRFTSERLLTQTVAAHPGAIRASAAPAQHHEWVRCLFAVFDVLTLLLHRTPAPTQAALLDDPAVHIAGTLASGSVTWLIDALQVELRECHQWGIAEAFRDADLG